MDAYHRIQIMNRKRILWEHEEADVKWYCACDVCGRSPGGIIASGFSYAGMRRYLRLVAGAVEQWQMAEVGL